MIKNIDLALKHISEKMEKNFDNFNNLFPDANTISGRYPKVSNYLSESGWTTGFWTGMLWMMYLLSKENKYKLMAEYHLTSFRVRLRENILIDHHDLGFLFLPSAFAQYKYTNFKKAEETVVWAANELRKRWIEPGNYLQAWGEIDRNKNGKFIIDCNLNVPLLFKAYDITKDKNYFEMAQKHLETACELLVRDDGSTYHSFNMEALTGKPISGETVQGFSDDSCWARGQAWAVYGFAIAFKRTGLLKFKNAYFKTAKYFINNLPKDLISFWDLCFNDDDSKKQERDTSAATIFANGVLIMSKKIGIENLEIENVALKILENLTNYYLSSEFEEGLLAQGVYNKKLNVGVNESVIWGDFYYMQAILMLRNINFYEIWE